MNVRHRLHSFLCATALMGAAAGWPGRAWADTSVDNRIYAELLQNYVHAGQVNYKGFKAEEAKLDRYLAALAEGDLKNQLETRKAHLKIDFLDYDWGLNGA
jgi:hypothetical protein